MTVAVTVAAEAATEATEQEDDEDDDEDGSKRHDSFSLRRATQNMGPLRSETSNPLRRAWLMAIVAKKAGGRKVQLAGFGIVRRRCNWLHLRPFAKPPPLIQGDAQRAARSRACFFVRVGEALDKRASAHKALIRMSRTWSAGKPPIRAHPISPSRCVEKLRDSSAYQLQRRGIGGGGRGTS